MNKTLIGILILLLGGAGFYIYNRSTLSVPTTGVDTSIENPNNVETDTTTGTTTSSTTSTSSISDSKRVVKEITIEGKDFAFTPTVISVNKGEHVRITFKNMGGTHNLVIDEYNVRTKKIDGGESDVIEFNADTVGSFEYYCSVGSHRQMGMKGMLNVQ